MSMMTGEELETLLDVTNASLQNWKKSGMPYEIDGNKHYYNLDTTLRWIHDNGMSKQRFTRYKLERVGEETAFGTLDEISEQTGILRTTLIAYKTRKKTHIKNSKISMLEYDKKEVMKIVANIENRKVNSNMDNKKIMRAKQNIKRQFDYHKFLLDEARNKQEVFSVFASFIESIKKYDDQKGCDIIVDEALKELENYYLKKS